ncbi:hypothetical protein C8F01DRAFT_976582 [Mycena amicta]|nr:hypothetical protein C8F01DRAFT_976582 [Mycena amicta]
MALLHTTIYSLPVELVSRIFALGAAHQYSDSPFLLRPDEDTAPLAASADFQLLVSQVCRHWRQVALRTSCLWTSLHFREPAHISRAETFLRRANANYSLDILVDTVSPEEHIPGVTLCCDEMRTIFEMITPHVARWRAFHLKVRANECKLIARQALSTCGPAPRLETLQLYHFEDYRTAHNLYIATYRDPVVIFNNVLPSLKNVSLIGVNLPWAHAPYLQQLDALELALHPDNIRPPYDAWDAMLRGSPRLRRLLLHYSGPRAASDEPSSRICVPTLEELSLTDLDPEHLATMLRTLELPRLITLSMDLPEQDFTGVVQLMTGTSPLHKSPPLPLAGLHTLRISALECQVGALAALIRGVSALRVLELDFSRISSRQTVCDVLLETTVVRNDNEDADKTCASTCGRMHTRRRIPVLRHLEEARLFGLDGTRIRALIAFRSGFMCTCNVGDSKAESTTASNTMPCPELTMPRFVVRWNAAAHKGRDRVLDELVESGQVQWVHENEGDEEDVDDDGASESGDSVHGPDTSDSADSED